MYSTLDISPHNNYSVSSSSTKAKVLISSCDTQNPSDFTVNLVTRYPNVRSIKLVSAAIPNTAYNVESGVNNTLTLIQGATTISVSIPEGTYGISQLLSTLQTALNDQGAAGTFACTYSPLTYKSTISNTTTAFYISKTQTHINETIGFYDPPMTPQLSHTSPFAVRMNSSMHFTMDLGLGGEGVNIPNLSSHATFVLPFRSEFETVTYLSEQDISQTVHFGTCGPDLNTLRIRLYRTDCPKPFRINSHFSFLLEIEYSTQA